MCNECWKEFRGWCRSFTALEAALGALQAALLLATVAFLVFLAGHFIVCGAPPLHHHTNGTAAGQGRATPPPARPAANVTAAPHDTVPPDVDCTWTPSVQTEPTARYYEGIATPSLPPTSSSARPATPAPRPAPPLALEGPDGAEAGPLYSALVLALVRRRGGGEPVFGCPLTALSEHWALTAASCVDAVEEADVLDAYMMMERWGAGDARAHAVADVRVHPRYGSQPTAHDAAALRSPDQLLRGAQPPRLPTLPDHLLLTIGERFTILGFGPFRSTGSGARTLRAVSVFTLSGLQCAGRGDEGEEGEGEGWAARHLAVLGPRPHAACAHGALCAGALPAPAATGAGAGGVCGYCGGTPLMRGGTLLALAVRAPCGEGCLPAPYLSLALIRDWIDDFIKYD